MAWKGFMEGFIKGPRLSCGVHARESANVVCRVMQLPSRAQYFIFIIVPKCLPATCACGRTELRVYQRLCACMRSSKMQYQKQHQLGQGRTQLQQLRCTCWLCCSRRYVLSKHSYHVIVLCVMPHMSQKTLTNRPGVQECGKLPNETGQLVTALNQFVQQLYCLYEAVMQWCHDHPVPGARSTVRPDRWS